MTILMFFMKPRMFSENYSKMCYLTLPSDRATSLQEGDLYSDIKYVIVMLSDTTVSNKPM